MGNRANILVKAYKADSGVYLYSHWGGTELPATLQNALSKHWRWDDPQYLTRIIFDEMTSKDHGGETGYGISTRVGDGASRILEVIVEDMRVVRGSKNWSFDEYVALKDTDSVWED
jgi:hypothetical protein